MVASVIVSRCARPDDPDPTRGDAELERLRPTLKNGKPTVAHQALGVRPVGNWVDLATLVVLYGCGSFSPSSPSCPGAFGFLVTGSRLLALYWVVNSQVFGRRVASGRAAGAGHHGGRLCLLAPLVLLVAYLFVKGAWNCLFHARSF